MPIRRIHSTHWLFRARRLVEVRVGGCGGNWSDRTCIPYEMMVMSLRIMHRVTLHVQWQPEFTVQDAGQRFGETERE